MKGVYKELQMEGRQRLGENAEGTSKKAKKEVEGRIDRERLMCIITDAIQISCGFGGLSVSHRNAINDEHLTLHITLHISYPAN